MLADSTVLTRSGADEDGSAFGSDSHFEGTNCVRWDNICIRIEGMKICRDTIDGYEGTLKRKHGRREDELGSSSESLSESDLNDHMEDLERTSKKARVTEDVISDLIAECFDWRPGSDDRDWRSGEDWLGEDDEEFWGWLFGELSC